jgi:glycosyltransferase involved in cell wall biosynthesis
LKIIVAQKSAREHFLAARALHRQGLLAGLVTDWYAFGQSEKRDHETTGPRDNETGGQRSVVCGPWSVVRSPWSVICGLWSAVCRPVVPRSALAARAEAIPDGLVRAFPFRSLVWKWRVRRLAAQGRAHEAYVQTDGAFAAVVARLKLPPHEVFFGYSYASLETLQAEKARGKMTVLCQIDPGPVHFRIVAEEMARFPELAGPPGKFPAAYYERNRREWELADIIVVNSEWSREALVAEGVNPAKLEILPLAFEAGNETTGQQDKKTTGLRDKGTTGLGDKGLVVSGHVVHGLSSVVSGQWSGSPRSAPLRVLWLGQVNVGKGIHYLMAAARVLEREKIHFDIVGPIGVLPATIASAPRNMIFHGPVSRDRAAEWYRQADVFVLPTLSDGFALTQLEALSHGLPVITTPNCGRVVEEGQTGFVVPARDAQALAEAILRFVRHPGLGREMAPACREAAAAYSVDAYGQHLVEIIERHMSRRSR